MGTLVLDYLKGNDYVKGQTYTILAIILVVIIAVFAVINVSTVEVNFLFGQAKSPLILVILFSVLMGGLITGAVGMVKVFKLQKDLKSIQAENKEMKTVLKKNGLINKVTINKDKSSIKKRA